MRNENDYMINLKAEIQIRSINQKIDVLLEGQIKTLFDTQHKQFLLLQEIKQKLDSLAVGTNPAEDFYRIHPQDTL